LDGVYERAESGEDLDVILSRIVDLDVPAAELDLWHGRDTRHRGGEVWQNHVASAELVGEDATSGADIDILSEFVNEAERRSLLGDCGRDGNKSGQARESKAKHYVAHFRLVSSKVKL
jgi:hypothetical protein